MTLGETLRRLRDARGWTQAELAERTGGKVTQQNISKIESSNQRKSQFAPALADAFGVPLSDLLVGVIRPDPGPRPSTEPPETVQIDEYSIRFAAGDGAIMDVDEYGEPASYRASWLRQMRLKPENLRRFRVQGDSMEPLMWDGDSILVDLSDTQPTDGRVYAIRYGDLLRVKRISKRVDGTLILRSDNPIYPPETVTDEITIIGRVRERCGTGGL